MEKKDINNEAIYSMYCLIQLAWRAVLCGKPTKSQKELYEQMINPVKGDLVCENTSGFLAVKAWRNGEKEVAVGHIKSMMGVLDEVIYEEHDLDEEARQDYLSRGEEIPKQKIHYVYNLEGIRFRWHNASFLKVPSTL
jgi:hypothetical protein